MIIMKPYFTMFLPFYPINTEKEIARKELRKATRMCDIPSLEGALLKVKRLRLPEEDGDISAAEEVLQTLRGTGLLQTLPLILHCVISLANIFLFLKSGILSTSKLEFHFSICE